MTQLTEKGQRDYELILKAKAGDQKSFAVLLEYYRTSVYLRLLNIVRNREDAEDLTIETFGKAFIHIDKYYPSNAFSTWLHRIATNTGIDFLRRKRHRLVSIEDGPKNKNGESLRMNIKGEDLTPEEISLKLQRVQYVRKYVEQLKPSYKRLIKLRYFKELSYNEISEATSIPIGTVKAQLHRARHALLAIIQDANEVF